jgi:predicted amidohydrolase
MMKAAIVQYEVGHAATIDDVLSRFREVVTDVSSADAELALFPEYVCIDLLPEAYRRNSKGVNDARGLIRHLPELNSEFFTGLGEIARKTGVSILAGTFLVDDAKGATHNSAVMVTPDGRRTFQDKLRISYELKANASDVAAGNNIHLVNVGQAEICTLVCYDAQFPDTVRLVADEAGPDLFLMPACALEPWGVGRLRTAASARAMESLSYVLSAHLVGSVQAGPVEIGPFFGRSIACSPVCRPFPHDGVIASASTDGPQVLVCDLDLAAIREAKSNGFPRPADRDVQIGQICPTSRPPQ